MKLNPFSLIRSFVFYKIIIFVCTFDEVGYFNPETTSLRFRKKPL